MMTNTLEPEREGKRESEGERVREPEREKERERDLPKKGTRSITRALLNQADF